MQGIVGTWRTEKWYQGRGDSGGNSIFVLNFPSGGGWKHIARRGPACAKALRLSLVGDVWQQLFSGQEVAGAE